jgi:outer membrane PBP1 activator LpoA protein
MSNSNPRLTAFRFPAWRLLLAVPALVLVLTACSTIASYDQTAYEHATSTKAETLLLMDRATTSYSQNTDKIDAVILDLNKAYEYDKGRARNQLTVRQWTKLLSPDDLFGAFIRKWKSKGQLHPGYIEVKKKDVEDAFDQIIELEQGKQKTGT